MGHDLKSNLRIMKVGSCCKHKKGAGMETKQKEFLCLIFIEIEKKYFTLLSINNPYLHCTDRKFNKLQLPELDFQMLHL